MIAYSVLSSSSRGDGRRATGADATEGAEERGQAGQGGFQLAIAGSQLGDLQLAVAGTGKGLSLPGNGSAVSRKGRPNLPRGRQEGALHGHGAGFDGHGPVTRGKKGSPKRYTEL